MQPKEHTEVVFVGSQNVPVVQRRVKTGHLGVEHRAQRLPLLIGWFRYRIKGNLPETARYAGVGEAFFNGRLVYATLQALKALQPFYGVALLPYEGVALPLGKGKELLQLGLGARQGFDVLAVAPFAAAHLLAPSPYYVHKD